MKDFVWLVCKYLLAGVMEGCKVNILKGNPEVNRSKGKMFKERNRRLISVAAFLSM